MLLFPPKSFKKYLTTLLFCIVTNSVLAKPVINEFVFNHTGADSHEYIEIYGEPKTDYSNLTVLEIEGDATGAGTVDGIFQVGVTNSKGFWTTDFIYSGLENGTVTLLLVRDFTGSRKMDLDSDDDGFWDKKPWAEIIDSIAVSDGGVSDLTYTEITLVPNYDGLPFTVGGGSRIPNGIDSDKAIDWQRNDFDFAANIFSDALNTPNTVNLNKSVALKKSIMQVQGKSHLSPFVGQLISVTGIVTAVAFNGFYLQDDIGDNDFKTSDAIFVFTNSRPVAVVGDKISVTGMVNEIVPGGVTSGNLSITQMFRPLIDVIAKENDLPKASVIGRSGRIPPNEKVIANIDDNYILNLYDPADNARFPYKHKEYGIDFYESLEAMLVLVESPSAVSPVRTFSYFSSEVFTVVNYGADVAPDEALNARGGIDLQPHRDNRGDQNPERVQIQFDRTLYGAPPLIKVGDKLTDVTGVVGYSFGNYEVNATQAISIIPSSLEQEITNLVGNQSAISVSSYNVLNLSATTNDNAQRSNIAAQIVNNLKSPDIIALQEIQDNNGEINDGTVDASHTLQALVDSIIAAGGPVYTYTTVNPDDGTSGGVPGGNIRNAFLYNSERVGLLNVVSLTKEVLVNAGVIHSNAFNGTRNPLLATFTFNDENISVINNHLTSRSGSTPIFGAIQPFFQAGEIERESQASALNDYVDFLLMNDTDAKIILLGDLNTFPWTNDLKYILSGKGDKKQGDQKGKRILHNLVKILEDDAVYTYIFDGNSQVLDNMFVTKTLKDSAYFDIVHVNNDFPRIDNSTASDHEPIVALFKIKRSGFEKY